MSGEAIDRVRRRAYEIWEREGRPEGREAEHWAMAETELRPASAAKRKRAPAVKAAAPRRKAAVAAEKKPARRKAATPG